MECCSLHIDDSLWKCCGHFWCVQTIVYIPGLKWKGLISKLFRPLWITGTLFARKLFRKIVLIDCQKEKSLGKDACQPVTMRKIDAHIL